MAKWSIKDDKVIDPTKEFDEKNGTKLRPGTNNSRAARSRDKPNSEVDFTQGSAEGGRELTL